MQIPILIEKLPAGQGFEARTGGPLGLSARAIDRDHAVRDLEVLVRAKLASDTEFAVLHFPEQPRSVPIFANFDPNDPRIEEWKRHVEDYRRECDLSDNDLVTAEGAR
jgi:hypothetical protein